MLATEWPYWNVFLGTGRPNNAGFADVIHLNYHSGPEYWDARHYLEPAAIRRLGLEYGASRRTCLGGFACPRSVEGGWLGGPKHVRAVDPRRGRGALSHSAGISRRSRWRRIPSHLKRCGRCRLRRRSTSTPQTIWLDRLRVASVLPHARLVGAISALPLHVRTSEPWTVEPLGEHVPDLIVLPASVEPWTWMFPPGSRQPIWQNAEVAVYAPNGTVAPITPSRAVPEAPPVAVEVADARIDDGRIVFATTFDDRAPERWTGQDWVIVELDAWAVGRFPPGFLRRRPRPWT